MSQGSPHVHVRVPRELLLALVTESQGSFSRRRGRPHNPTSFVQDAIREKIAHMQRSRKPRKRKRP
jgi:hypothetical protein